jgi:hypothetical protein
MNEIKVGDWTITPEGLNRLCGLAIIASLDRARLHRMAAECCEILNIDATTDTVARDICEEIVFHGTPVDEVVAKLQRHLASPHSGDFS